MIYKDGKGVMAESDLIDDGFVFLNIYKLKLTQCLLTMSV